MGTIPEKISKPRRQRKDARPPQPEWRIERGPYLEAYMLRAQKSKPDIIIRYGHSLDYRLGTFADAERFGRRILALDALEHALCAVQDMLNGDRDDFERVGDLVDKALSSLDPDRALPPPRNRRLIWQMGRQAKNNPAR